MEQPKSTTNSLGATCGSPDQKKKKRKFHPKTVPRYLIGSEKKAVIIGDLREYNDHRYKVFNATCRVDSTPPAFHPNKYLKQPQLCSALEAYGYIERQNKILLHKINAINRSRGYIDSFNKLANNQCSKWGMKKTRFQKIDDENMQLYNKIVKSKTSYSKAAQDKFWSIMLEVMLCSAKFPYDFQKETSDSILKRSPSITKLEDLKSPSFVESLKRPRIFLEFKLDGHVNIIGRILFELYNDICPRTVENFLTICGGPKEAPLSYKNSLLHRIYLDKYCVMGDITKRNGKGGISIYGDFFDAENFQLEHSRAGVLSMICFKDNKVNSQFCLTFTAVPEMNGKQVVFGKCIKGSEFLKKLSDYGQPTGKPLGPLLICNCGIVKRKKKKVIVDTGPKKDYIQCNIDAVLTKRKPKQHDLTPALF